MTTPEDRTSPEPVLTGKVDRRAIRMLRVPRLPPHIIDGFRALGDITCAVSDGLEELGICGAIAGSTLRTIIPGSRLVGTALTLRNEPRPEDPFEVARDKDNRMGETECHNLALPGDVLVIQGVQAASNLGGIGGRMSKRQGVKGAIVDGAVRDVGDFRSIEYPIWSAGVTPLSGKWRVQAAEINGPVSICGVMVNPGDLVVADDSGVCFVPRARVDKVLALTRRKVDFESEKCRQIDEGWTVPEITGAVPRREPG